MYSNKPKRGVPKYPHKMYKGVMVKTAKNEKEHNMLMKMGYNHTKPKG